VRARDFFSVVLGLRRSLTTSLCPTTLNNGKEIERDVIGHRRWNKCEWGLHAEMQQAHQNFGRKFPTGKFPQSQAVHQHAG
jgi:hypothetical protein